VDPYKFLEEYLVLLIYKKNLIRDATSSSNLQINTIKRNLRINTNKKSNITFKSNNFVFKFYRYQDRIRHHNNRIIYKTFIIF